MSVLSSIGDGVSKGDIYALLENKAWKCLEEHIDIQLENIRSSLEMAGDMNSVCKLQGMSQALRLVVEFPVTLLEEKGEQ